ncbi:hypothetical protein EVAR_36841_1 [Eumeta japonica]|uniref:Uncharacterized protein n=1 Tax=Eumeta variegata TaxID=151549 RepID=A0A4C1WE20_EUMVA|nr:hypothetical protein EVAR_36841_1 [Eumeta japonica]
MYSCKSAQCCVCASVRAKAARALAQGEPGSHRDCFKSSVCHFTSCTRLCILMFIVAFKIMAMFRRVIMKKSYPIHVVQYNARSSAAGKFVAKASQWRGLARRGEERRVEDC